MGVCVNLRSALASIGNRRPQGAQAGCLHLVVVMAVIGAYVTRAPLGSLLECRPKFHP
jgi:hypothetical protein